MMNRRRLLQSIGLFGAAGLVGSPALLFAASRSPHEDFTFIFFTDTHMQPELNATVGCDMCSGSFHHIPADFVICGGDLMYDAAGVSAQRADDLFLLYRRTSSVIPDPVHHTIGNHDNYGVLTKSGISPTDPQYGKKAFEDRYGPTPYSFDHKGWHFIVLDWIVILPGFHVARHQAHA